MYYFSTSAINNKPKLQLNIFLNIFSKASPSLCEKIEANIPKFNILSTLNLLNLVSFIKFSSVFFVYLLSLIEN